MNTQNIILKINEFQRLEIQNCYFEGNHICQYDALEIFFVDKDKKYKLYDNIILCDLSVFKEMLQKAIDNKLVLDDAIQASLGFLWNASLQREEDSTQKDFDISNYFSLWGSGPGIEYSTWLYNKNNIINMEISPDYPWHFIQPNQGQQYISYEEWKKNYKSLFIGEINRETIQEWIRQIDEILIKMRKDELNHKQL